MDKKVKLELVGLDGNAFSLLGAFSKAARRQGWTPEEIKVVRDKATSGNYDNLLMVLAMHTESPDEDEDDGDSDECDNCGWERDECVCDEDD
jgi:hypothetical protein